MSRRLEERKNYTDEVRLSLLEVDVDDILDSIHEVQKQVADGFQKLQDRSNIILGAVITGTISLAVAVIVLFATGGH